MYQVVIDTLTNERIEAEVKTYNEAYNLAILMTATPLFRSVRVYRAGKTAILIQAYASEGGKLR
jgi:hypothetical protein